MRKSTSIIEITKALLAVQGELEPVPFDGINEEFGSKYSTFTEMWAHARPVLQKHKLVMVQNGGDRQVTPGYMSLETTLIHESGEWITGTFSIPVKETTPHAGCSAITYAKRYGLGAILGLISGDDDDGNAASGKGKKPAASKPAAAKPAKKTPARDASQPVTAQQAEKLLAEPNVDTDKTFKKAQEAIKACVSRKGNDADIDKKMDKEIAGHLERVRSYNAIGKLTDEQSKTLRDLSKGEFHA